MINNNACILTINKSLSAETMRALELISTKAGERFTVTTKAYSSVKPLLAQLGERLEENVLVIIAAEAPLFYGAKEILCQALSLKLENSDDVIASLPTTYSPKSEREYKVVAGFPKNCDIIYSPNGLFSGFCAKSGTQRIMFLPLDQNLITIMLNGTLTVQLDRIADENNIVVADIMSDDGDISEGEAITAEEPAEAEAAAESETTYAPEAPAAAPEEPVTIEASSQEAPKPAQSSSSVLVSSANEMIATLKETGYTVAFSQCGPFKSLKSLVAALPEAGDYVIFDDVPAEKWNSGDFNEYFAKTAKTTLEKTKADIAGAASTIYSDQSGKFMFFVVADEKGAKIKKISGDDANEIIYRCVTGLIKAITERTAARVQEEGVKERPQSSKIVKSSTPLIIAAVVLIIAVIASAAVAFYLKSADKNAEEPETSVTDVYEDTYAYDDSAYIEETSEETAEETAEESTDEAESDTEIPEESAE